MTPPLGPISLSFSGGGGRAAGFHLGTLVYLDRLNILKDVTILSTVSGGSFVGASYALALKEAPPGEDLHVTCRRYFETFRTVLLTSQLLPWALQRMARGQVKVPSGRENLVTALAQVYDDTFLHHASFGVFWNDREIHLKEIIFNATEFQTGNAFRFQRSPYPCVIGNEHVSVSEEHARKMRLADVVACSSCIPIGLEPVVFPDDFRWPDDQPALCDAIKADLMARHGINAFPIMDGGVYDNQGIESVLLAVRRDFGSEQLLGKTGVQASMTDWFRALLSSHDDLGTFIISDAPLVTGSDLAAPPPPAKGSFVTLQHLNVATLVLLGMSVLSIVYLLGHQQLSADPLHPLSQADDFFLYAIPMALAMSLIVMLVYVRRRVNALLAEFPQSGHGSWAEVRKLKVAAVMGMVRLRLSSTWALTTWVYFNRIRQLGYDLILGLPGSRRHVIAHEIDDLLSGDVPGERLAWLKPSAAAQEVAQRASTLATKLWFDSPQELDDTIACGQMTMCFNVLTHLEQHYPVRNTAQQEVYDLARADWDQLQADPFAELSTRGDGVHATPC